MSFLRERPPLALLCLLGAMLVELPAAAFSSGSPLCIADASQMTGGHGPSFGVTGTYSIQVRRAGNPTTSVLVGETVQVLITNPQNVSSKGFTLRAQLGSTSGAGVGGLTPGSGQKVMTGCSPSNSGVTQTTSVAVLPPRSVNWTVPNTLSPGQQVFFSALVSESSIGNWAVVNPVSVTVAAATPVPGLGLFSLVTAGAGLVGFAAWRMRRS